MAAADRFLIEEATIEDIHRAMQAGSLTARGLVEHYLKRIEAYDKKGPAINSIIAVNRQAIALAEELDAQWKQTGDLKPLHGIPVLLKDAIATHDLPTTGGSISLQGFIPPEDATLVRKLRQAGAIILAKVNLDEFTFGTQTVSSLLGQTRNPYDLTRNPAGSSGGTAAAVAANFGAVGIGTDTGCSIRFPASANSLVGLRPTTGLISRRGIIPNSYASDMAGPMTRTVADAARLLEVLAGYDPGDGMTAWGVGHVPEAYTAFLDRKGLTGVRIGVLKSFFGTGEDCREVSAAAAGMIEVMEREGGVIAALDAFIDIGELREMQVSTYETKAYFNAFLQHWGPGVPVKSLAEIIALGKHAPECADSLRKREALSMDDPGYRERLMKGMKLQENILKIMADGDVDVLVYPHQRSLVAKIGAKQAQHNGYLAAVTGFPAIVVPAGFSEPTEDAPLGVPIGLEMLGRPWSEPLLLKAAYALEQATKLRRPPASTPYLML